MPESSPPPFSLPNNFAARSERVLATAVEAMAGTARTGQLEMLREVCGALDDQAISLIQAGTGTGKSLAYLIPAMVRASERDERIVISTATLALQRQLLSIDIPRAVSSLQAEKIPVPSVALLKGRHNYLCLHKVGGGYPTDDTLFDDGLIETSAPGSAPSELGRQVLQLREWAKGTTTGDRDDMPQPVGEKAWQQVSVTARDCLGAMCPMVKECFSEKARLEAAEAQIVITNHALLGVAAAGHPVLGEYDGLIVDEAHELVDRVRGQATVMLTPAIIERVDRAVRKAGVVNDGLGSAANSLRLALETTTPGRFATELPEPIVEVLQVLRASAREAMSSLKDGAKESAPHKVALAQATEIHDVAARLLSDRLATSQDVVWAHAPHANTPPVINVAPLQVASDISGRLFNEHSVVLTSATLTIAKKFQHFARSVGLGRGSYREADVASPFNYRKQGILYIARQLPPPGRDGLNPEVLAEIQQLIEAAGGATLGLFTSRRAAEVVGEHLRESTELPILVQGEAPISYLQEQFLASRDRVLLGTRSLWQGIDVPGDVCQLVIIDRIPFPRPDDPITTAQQELVRQRGGNPFMDVAVADAALTLAQGVGRLIRRVSDQGVVAILDSRLATARYGAVLRQSLPDLWPTADSAVARAALTRLRDATVGNR